MKEFDFFEKLYLAEITIRGQVLTLFSLSFGITVAVATGLATQVVAFPYQAAPVGMAWTFSLISAVTLVPLALAAHHLYRSHKPVTYKLLDDALLYRDYFKDLKKHCEESADDGDTKTAKEKFDEWAQEDVIERLVDAASHNRTVNYTKLYRLNRNHFWISFAATGTLVSFILKSVGG